MTKNVKSLASRSVVKAVAVVLGVLLAGLIGYVAAIRPEAAKVKRIKAHEATAQATLSAYDQKLALAHSVPNIRFADVYRLAKSMPSTTDMPDVLLELSQIARDSGITFTSIQPEAMTALNGYSGIPISLTFDGNFYNLADLLYRLRLLVTVHTCHLDSTGRLFSVDNFSFAVDTGDGDEPASASIDPHFPIIKATVIVDAFVYGTQGAVPAAVPAGSSTTTSTTTTSTTSTTPTTPASTTPTANASAAGAH